ncbi:hypothetical protein Tco_0140867 [Tanacetum coccineum]
MYTVRGDGVADIKRRRRELHGDGVKNFATASGRGEEVVPKVDDVSLVDGVFDCAFGGDGEEYVLIGEGVVVASLLLEMLTKSFLGGMMVSLIFLEGLEEEA